MTKSVKPIIRSQSAPPPLAQQQAIAAQTAAFLSGGGKIQKIPNGVSGQQRLGGPMFAKQAAAAPAPEQKS
jgi:hypothetical protein